jgi:hypothetical protein
MEEHSSLPDWSVDKYFFKFHFHQLACFAMLWIVKEISTISIFFPIMVKNIVWFKRVLDRSPEQRESKMAVLCPLITIIFISYIIIYYNIIKLLIMEDHPSQNRKQSFSNCDKSAATFCQRGPIL